MVESIEARIKRGLTALEKKPDAPLCEKLIETWSDGLVNRAANDDRSRIDRYIAPAFGHRRTDELTLKLVMEWIDEMQAGGELSGGTMRANVNLLSRFCSWTVERGYALFNPVRQIPPGKRPRQISRTDTPWLDDDAMVRRIFHALPEPLNMMFYVGNRSGMRLGEICGLRMSDLGFLDDGTIRVRFSYNGPLKEDKRGEGKVKWVPAADDLGDVLADWLLKRRNEGANPESLVFLGPAGDCFNKTYTSRAWKDMRAAVAEDKTNPVKLDLTWYQATRHSFVSRNLSRGVSLDEVSAAVGHSSPMVTKRYYDHFVRKQFSVIIRAGIGMRPAEPCEVICFPREAGERGV